MSSSELSFNSRSGSTTDELRLKSYRNQLQQKHEIEVRDILARNADEIQRLTDTHSMQLESLRNAYDVQISEEAEMLEEKLHEVRTSNGERVSSEKRVAEQELEKIKTAEHLKIDEYKKNADVQIEALHKQLRDTSEVLHEQAKRTARRERESARL